MLSKLLFGSIVLFIFVPSLWAGEARSVAEGNRLFEAGDYDAALSKYLEAGEMNPNSAIISFNEGAAYYKKGEFEKAVEAFSKATMSSDPILEAAANYNIGNSTYKLGTLKENTDLEEALNRYQDALAYYKRALELDSDYKKAKYNHEYLEKKIKKLLDQLKQQQQQQDQQQQQQQKQGQEEQEQQQKNQQQQQRSEEKPSQEEKETQQQKQQTGRETEPQEQEEQKERSAQKQQEEKKQQEAEETQAGEGSEQPSQEQKDSQAEGEETEQYEMSEEEARMILEGYRQNKESQKLLNVAPNDSGYRQVGKDW